MSSRTPREREVKACKRCAKAKVRCELATGREKCRRCERLSKECENQVPGAHSSHKRPPATHKAILRRESKVDSVSDLLSTASCPPLSSLSPSPFSDSLTGNAPSFSAFAVLDQTIPPNGYEAAFLLSLFRTEMAPLFPFVSLQDDTTPAQLRHRKPALYMSVVMVACQSDPDRQLNIARMVRYEISQAVLVRGEKSLALLQALLILIAWNHVHLQLGNQLVNYLHISSAMVSELGLNKEANHRSKTSAGAIGDLGQDGRIENARTLEERRVFLGLCWTNSITKTYLKDITPIRFTLYADQCCRILESTMEHPSDAYLVQLIHVQRKTDKITDMLYTEESTSISGMSMPLLMGVSSLEQEIQTPEISLPSTNAESTPLAMSNQSVKLYLCKIALDDRLFHSPSSPNDTNTARYSMFRTNLLASCLAAIHSLLSLFLALPTDIMLSLPYPHWGQMGHALLILTRLSEVRHEAWDAAYVSSVLDLRETYTKVTHKMEEVMATGRSKIPSRNFPTVFELLAARLRELGETARLETSIPEDIHLVPDDDFVTDLFFGLLDLDQLY